MYLFCKILTNESSTFLPSSTITMSTSFATDSAPVITLPRAIAATRTYNDTMWFARDRFIDAYLLDLIEYAAGIKNPTFDIRIDTVRRFYFYLCDYHPHYGDGPRSNLERSGKKPGYDPVFAMFMVSLIHDIMKVSDLDEFDMPIIEYVDIILKEKNVSFRMAADLGFAMCEYRCYE